MKGHYLLLEITISKTEFERVYLPLEREDEDPDEARERWIAAQVKKGTNSKSRVKTIERVRNQATESIAATRVCRPTSWHREQAEAEGRPFPSTPMKSRRRRAAA